MSKEELLKQEAEENSFRYTLDKPWACEAERKQIMAHFEKGYLASAESREKRIAELEKENAELKVESAFCEKACEGTEMMYKNLQKVNNQLTKAKELLKNWVQTSKASGCDNINIVTDTEQFLSGVEK